MQNHDDRHDQRKDVDYGCCAFEDDGVCKFDVARETICFDADARGRGEGFAEGCAERKGCIFADGGEVTEAGHFGGWRWFRGGLGKARRSLSGVGGVGVAMRGNEVEKFVWKRSLNCIADDETVLSSNSQSCRRRCGRCRGRGRGRSRTPKVGTRANPG